MVSRNGAGFVPATTLHLDRPRRFLLNFWCVKLFQERTGTTLQKLMQRLVEGADEVADDTGAIELLAELVAAGCNEEDPDLTAEQVMKSLGPFPAEQLRPVFEAIAAAIPGGDDGDGSPLAETVVVPSPSERSGRNRGRSRKSNSA